MSRLTVRSILGTVAIAVVGLIVAPITASAATNMLIRGTVTCSGGQAAVGVWIESSAGGSEWADDQSWQFSSSRKTSRYFEETIRSPSSKTKVSLHVGCGGSPKAWGKDLWSTEFTVGSKGKVINVFCDYGKRQRKVGACVSASAGRKSTTIPYYDASGRYPGHTSGYCTGGAVYQWYKATGYWPYINRGAKGISVGDAKYMDDHAEANKFRVVDVPHVNSLVVFDTGTFGHVGWVTKISRKSGKVVLEYTDRNGGKFENAAAKRRGITEDFGKDIRHRTKAWDPKIQHFIVAPVK